MKGLPQNHDENLQKAERIAYLIAGHLKDTLSELERDELDEWITESDENLELFENLTDEDNIEAGIQKHRRMEKEKAEALAGVKEKIGIRQKTNLRKLWPYLAAASVVLIAGSLYILNHTKDIPAEKPIAQRTTKSDIQAGSDKAVLTLSDGRTIILNSTVSGLLANEGSISIKKNEHGEIAYEGTEQQMKYNTVSTPRGGEYKLVLGDGTEVWLNAESSIKFPAGFAANDREVELRGEAYFEVAKNATKPFKVSIITPNGSGGTVTVLGTKFNINAYTDEATVKTMLVEGSVRVEKNNVSKIISPGEQALSSNVITVIKADVREAIAWKEGKFLFRDATIRSIGEQLKRWYDIEVEYQGTISQHFNTEVSRNIPLSKLLSALEATVQVHFNLTGKKLVIKP
jgi:ferric-dicitrate binding protein FerR (iron transport regulator)